MQFKYTEFAVGIADRGKIYDGRLLPALIAKNQNRDCYINTLLFDTPFVNYVKNTNSVSGYRGSAFMPSFPIDIDDSDISQSQQVAKLLINFLENNFVPIEFLKIYFSGNKGFHILIPNSMIGSVPSESISKQMQNFAKELLENFEYDSTIYNHVRLFRVKNTRHQKSGLYKIPITLKELFGNINDILELAKAPREIELSKYEGSPIQFLNSMWQDSAIRAGNIYDIKPVEIDEKSEYKFFCHRNIFNNPASEGYRNATALRVAWILKKHSGMPYELTLNSLKEWNKKNKPPLETEELEVVVKQAYKGIYGFNCSDNIIQMYCDERCPFFLKKSEEEKPIFQDLAQIGDKYLSFLDTYKNNKMGFGHRELDVYLRGLLPKFVTYILARSGVGKTSFMIDCIQRMLDEYNKPIVMFSLEMSAEMLLERFLSRHLKINSEKIFNLAEDITMFRQYVEQMNEKYSKLIINDKSSLSVEEMGKYLDFVEEKVLGEKVRVVFIDYFGLINQPASSDYEKMSKIALSLQRFAKERNVAVVSLVQTNREKGTDGSSEVTMDSGRGSGVIEETADVILGMWVNADVAGNEMRIIRLLKNRYGKSNVDFVCDGNIAQSTWNLKETFKIHKTRGEIK